MKFYLATFFILLSQVVSAQKMQIPKHKDGSPIANEKFEMLEKSWKRFQAKDQDIRYPLEDSKLSARGGLGELQVGDDFVVESEIHAAVNPLDINNIVVGVIKFNNGNVQKPLSVSIYVTYDFGDSWERSDFDGWREGNITVGGGDPMFAFDSEGSLYFSWLQLDLPESLAFLRWGMYAARSDDGGLNWTRMEKAIELDIVTDTDFLSDLNKASDKQWMSADLSKQSPYRGNVYMAYVVIDPNLGTYRIMFKRKKEDEAEFQSNGILLHSSNQMLSQFTNVEVDREGNIYVIFLADADDRLHMYTTYLTVSTDGGDSFSNPEPIQDLYFPDFGSDWMPVSGLSSMRSYPCPQLGLDRSEGRFGGRLYYTFTAYGLDTLESPGLDVYLMHSDDKGITWREPTIVNDDLDLEKHQFYSSIAINKEGDVVIAWYDRRADLDDASKTEYYLGYSEDGGESFTQFPVTAESSNFEKIQSRNGDFGIGEYNEVITAGDYMIPFWADGRTDDGSIAVYAYFYNKDGVGVLDKQVLLTDKVSVSTPQPNPAQDAFSFSMNLEEASYVKLQLVNQFGQAIRTIANLENTVGYKTYIVNTEGLETGIYFLRAETSFGQLTHKVMVNENE